MDESAPDAAVDRIHGNGQADELANQGTAAHGPLDPDDTWTSWADWEQGLPLLEVSGSATRVSFPAEALAADPADPGNIGNGFPGSSFQSWTASACGTSCCLSSVS
eukprot:4829841-Amphidinium_carterae.1